MNTLVMQYSSRSGIVTVSRISEETIAELLDRAPWMSDIYFLMEVSL